MPATGRAGRRRRPGRRADHRATCSARSRSTSTSSVNVVAGATSSTAGRLSTPRSGSCPARWSPRSRVQATPLVGPGNAVVAIQVNEGVAAGRTPRAGPGAARDPCRVRRRWVGSGHDRSDGDRRRRGGVADHDRRRLGTQSLSVEVAAADGADRRGRRRCSGRAHRADRRPTADATTRRARTEAGSWRIVALVGDCTTTTAVALAAAWPVEDEVDRARGDRSGGSLAGGSTRRPTPSLTTFVAPVDSAADDRRRRCAARGVTSRPIVARVEFAGVRFIAAPGPIARGGIGRSARRSLSCSRCSPASTADGAGRRRPHPAVGSAPGDRCPAPTDIVVVHRQDPASPGAAAVRLERLVESMEQLGPLDGRLVPGVIGDDPFDVDEIADLRRDARVRDHRARHARSPSTRCRRWSSPAAPASPPSG